MAAWCGSSRQRVVGRSPAALPAAWKRPPAACHPEWRRKWPECGSSPGKSDRRKGLFKSRAMIASVSICRINPEIHASEGNFSREKYRPAALLLCQPISHPKRLRQPGTAQHCSSTTHSALQPLAVRWQQPGRPSPLSAASSDKASGQRIMQLHCCRCACAARQIGRVNNNTCRQSSTSLVWDPLARPSRRHTRRAAAEGGSSGASSQEEEQQQQQRCPGAPLPPPPRTALLACLSACSWARPAAASGSAVQYL